MGRRWTAREDAELSRRYRAGAPVREIALELQRSEEAVNVRRAALGLAPRRVPWSARDDALLRAADAAGLPAEVVARRLGRPVSQIRWRRRRLGLTAEAPARYASEEDAALRRVFASGGDLEQLAARLGRTTNALRLRAAHLDLYEPARRRRWTAGEDAVVREGYETGLTCEEIARELPGRRAGSVAARATKLGLATHARRWTADDDQRLRWLAVGHGVDAIARRLGRTPDALRQRASKLGVELRELPAARSGQRWTEAEDEFLRLHPGLNPASSAAALGRSDRAVTIRLAALGLREGRERSPHRLTRSPARSASGAAGNRGRDREA